ncbi:MAG: universal stress protein [Acidobacteria bacterium]|nr:MAG: universal stress protein [Acidobacteriota bacterium]
MLPFAKILSTTDFSEASYEGVCRAAELAKWFNAELSLVYVVPTIPTLPPGPNYGFEIPEYEEALLNNADERLRDFIRDHLPGDMSIKPIVAYGDAAKEIVRIAREEGVSLIAMATHGLSGWRHLVSGSVTEKVIRLADCPVLAIRIPRHDQRLAQTPPAATS